MVNTKLEAQCKAILHFWMNGIHSPKEIHEKMNIPLCTIENNLKKLKETGIFITILLFQHLNLQ